MKNLPLDFMHHAINQSLLYLSYYWVYQITESTPTIVFLCTAFSCFRCVAVVNAALLRDLNIHFTYVNLLLSFVRMFDACFKNNKVFYTTAKIWH